MGVGVCGQVGEGFELGSGWFDVVTGLDEQGPDLMFGAGDGGGDDAGQFGERWFWWPEAQPQEGDEGFFGDAERGWVPAGWFAGGRAAAADVEAGVALGVVGEGQGVDQLVPFGGGQAGQGGVCPAGAFGAAG